MAFDVLYRGDHFLLADKPAGWLSVPSRFGERDERPCLGREIERLIGARAWPVHRLDEEVSGANLFATTAEAHRAANQWFEKGLVRKTYEALSGVPAAIPGGTVVWRSRLLRGKKRAYESPHGKDSVTRATASGETVAFGAPAVAWTLEPLTGRAHQLRFEMAEHGACILGDVLYGARSALPGGAIALRCVRLELPPDATAFGLPAVLEASPLATWIAGLPAEGSAPA